MRYLASRRPGVAGMAEFVWSISWPINPDPDDIISHLLDVTRLVLDRVRDGIWPLVVDPARSLIVGDLDHFPDEGNAIGVLDVEQVLANQSRTGAVRHIQSV